MQERSTLRVGSSVTLDLSQVIALKVLNDKLSIVTSEGMQVEISGLSPGAIDALFAAYTRWTGERHALTR